MTYFIFDGVIQPHQPIHLTGEEASHILQSRRIKKNETINVQDATQRRFRTTVVEVGRRALTVTPIEPIPVPPQSPLSIRLFQALVKEKAVDNIVQKTTELGINEIVFFQSTNSQQLRGEQAIQKKLSRWQKIAWEACKQSDRVAPPEIVYVERLGEHPAIAQSQPQEVTICLDNQESSCILTELAVPLSLNLLVGPEGGWHPAELKEVPHQVVTLGPRTLRADTATIAAVSIVQHLFGDM